MKTNSVAGFGLNQLPSRRWTGMLGAMLMLLTVSAEAQTHTVLKSFGGFTDGSGGRSRSPLVRAVDGAFYGTTFGEFGAIPLGSIFKINSDGTGYSVVKWFTNSAPEGLALDGIAPGNLVLAGNIIYGTAGGGGTIGGGTIFKLNTDGTGFTVLKNLDWYVTGASPSSLMLSGNTLFGTTASGGSQWGTGGTLFKVNTDGSDFAVVKQFTGNLTNGEAAMANGGLLQSGNTRYGMSSGGGAENRGTVFKVNTDGSGYEILKEFLYADEFLFLDGNVPVAGLALAGNTLYGTTAYGGNGDKGTVFKVNTEAAASPC
jgi:uncharacterized repeat protein (TIGR03803 family)